jgi:hypothetical protein
MARHLIPSDTTIRTIKPGDPRKRLSDGDGLVLLLFVNGSGEHGWRFDYRFGGKRNMLSLGTYPDTTLAMARRKADAVRPCWPRASIRASSARPSGRHSPRCAKRTRAKLHGAPHLVPLPKQAVAVLRDLHKLTGYSTMVFRGERHHDRAMSENTINAALRAMGFPQDEVTGHGFRATARTMLHERLGFDPHVIEAQLAHSVRDSLGRAYNCTEFVEQRRKMLQAWADYLDKLRRGAPVVQIGRRKS